MILAKWKTQKEKIFPFGDSRIVLLPFFSTNPFGLLSFLFIDFFLISIFFFNFYLFIYLGCVGSSFLCKGFLQLWQAGATLHRGALSPLTVAASLVGEHRLQMRRLSNCGSRAQLLRGMWDLSRPGTEPVSPALAGRLSTTAPPGKPLNFNFILKLVFHCIIKIFLFTY